MSMEIIRGEFYQEILTQHKHFCIYLIDEAYDSPPPDQISESVFRSFGNITRHEAPSARALLL